MNRTRDNEYQDSRAPGALVGALSLWRALQRNDTHTQPQHLTFALACSSESRALCVAAFLRRNRACATTRVDQIEAHPRTDWRVQGATRREVQSLPNLEGLFTWLREAAHAHQVNLLDLSLA